MDKVEGLQFPDAPEPIALKGQAIEQRRKDPTWDSDSLLAWFGNKLPSYFWTDCGWGHILKREGLTWPDFLECLSAWKIDIIQWLRNELAWEDLVADLRRTAPRFKPWLDTPHRHGLGYFPLRDR